MLRKGISRVSRRWRSTELAAAPFVPAVNASHVPTAARLPPVLSDAPDTSVLPPVSADHWDESWGADALASAHESNVVATWGPTKAIAGVPMMVRGEGVYLYDAAGKEYIDWTSQAICVNLGHSPPPAVQEAVARQLNALPFVYGGLAATEPRARLAALLSEVMPADLNGFLFPSGGAEANEAAVRVARRYTGRRKVLSMYRSYHGGTSTTLAATGDFRRNFDEATAVRAQFWPRAILPQFCRAILPAQFSAPRHSPTPPLAAQPTGFVKMVNPTPLTFKWAEDDSEGTALSLAALEEQIIGEGPETIAAIMAESVVGSGGVFVHPPGYMQGVRALCDRYGTPPRNPARNSGAQFCTSSDAPPVLSLRHRADHGRSDGGLRPHGEDVGLPALRRRRPRHRHLGEGAHGLVPPLGDGGAPRADPPALCRRAARLGLDVPGTMGRVSDVAPRIHAQRHRSLTARSSLL